MNRQLVVAGRLRDRGQPPAIATQVPSHVRCGIHRERGNGAASFHPDHLGDLGVAAGSVDQCSTGIDVELGRPDRLAAHSGEESDRPADAGGARIVGRRAQVTLG